MFIRKNKIIIIILQAVDGATQDSVLGQKLFVNDLCNVCNLVKCILFADDTSLFCSDANVNRLFERVSSVLASLCRWFATNKLSLNVLKTSYMLFRNKAKKEANIIPLFKKGSRNKSVNYRTVGLTSVICKLLETIIRDHMTDFLIKQKLINPSQHGFLKAKSCLTILLCFLEEITKWVDDGSPVDVIYLDFQKAFDKVPHQRLIRKLKSHGIGNSIINWIEHWLTDRRQRVVVDGEVSSWKSVLIGVPQGSVLEPILCLVYINDLEEGVTGKILKFADYTKLFRKVKEIGDKQNLQDDIDKLVRWSEKWQMLLHFGKCKCLHTGPGNTGMNYEMGGTILSKP